MSFRFFSGAAARTTFRQLQSPTIPTPKFAHRAQLAVVGAGLVSGGALVSVAECSGESTDWIKVCGKWVGLTAFFGGGCLVGSAGLATKDALVEGSWGSTDRWFCTSTDPVKVLGSAVIGIGLAYAGAHLADFCSGGTHEGSPMIFRLLHEREVLNRAPLTDQELREIRDMFSAGFIEIAKQQNLTQTETDEGLEGLDGMIHFWRFSFAGMQMAEGGEGFITKERFLQCLPTDNADRQRLADLLWRRCDQNADGKISCKEFILTLGADLAPRDHRLKASFACLDEDRDGKLSKEEFRIWVSWALHRACWFKRVGEKAGEPTADEQDFMAANVSAVDGYTELVNRTNNEFKEMVSSKEFNSLSEAEKRVKIGPAFEAQKVIQDSYRGELSTRITNEIFAKYDTNKDGKLQLEEFMQIAKGTVPMVSMTNTHWKLDAPKA